MEQIPKITLHTMYWNSNKCVSSVAIGTNRDSNLEPVELSVLVAICEKDVKIEKDLEIPAIEVVATTHNALKFAFL